MPIQTMSNEGSKTERFLQCLPNHPLRVCLVALGVIAVIAALPIGLAHINSIASFSLGGAGLALIAGVALKAYFFPRDVVIVGESFMDRKVHRQMGLRMRLRFKAFIELQQLNNCVLSIAAKKQRVVLVYTQGTQSDANFVSPSSPGNIAAMACERNNIPWCIYVTNADDGWDTKRTSGWNGKPYILGKNSKLPFTRNSAILTKFLNQ